MCQIKKTTTILHFDYFGEQWGASLFSKTYTHHMSQHSCSTKRRQLSMSQAANSPDTKSAGLCHGLPASINVRNKCSLFKPPPLWYFCYNSPKWLRQDWIVSPPNLYVETLTPSISNVTVVGHMAWKRWLSEEVK